MPWRRGVSCFEDLQRTTPLKRAGKEAFFIDYSAGDDYNGWIMSKNCIKEKRHRQLKRTATLFYTINQDKLQ